MKYIKFLLLIKVIFNITTVVANDPELNYLAIENLEKAVSIAPYSLDDESINKCIKNFQPTLDINDITTLLTVLEINCQKVQNSYVKKFFGEKDFLEKNNRLKYFQSTVKLSLWNITSP